MNGAKIEEDNSFFMQYSYKKARVVEITIEQFEVKKGFHK